MAYIFKKIFPLFLALTALTAFLSVACGALSASQQVSAFKSAPYGVICIAHRGDWHSFPENSAEAVNAAADYGIVSVDLKLTSDNEVVLMADETTDRMCVDENGAAVTGTVRGKTLSELKKLYLREENGSADKTATDCRIPTLEEVADAAGENCALMLNTRCDDFKVIFDKVNELGIGDSVIFRFSDNIDTIVKTVKGINGIAVTGNYQGNIIFLAVSALNKCRENGITALELGSTNGHGVLYDRFLMKRFTDKRAMVSMVNGRCGKRADSEQGWDDLISRGYSVIETNYPKQLCEYLVRLQQAETELEATLDLYGGTDTAPFTTDTESEFSSAVSNARETLNSISSLGEIQGARYRLQNSYNSLTVGPKKAVTLSFNFSIARVAVVVLCGAAFILSQIFLFKKRGK